MSTFKYKLLDKMYRYSRKKLREKVKKDIGVNLRCSNCNTWEDENVLEGYNNAYTSATYNGEEFGYRSVCGRCGQVTYWNAIIAPVVLLCDHTGMPIEGRKTK